MIFYKSGQPVVLSLCTISPQRVYNLQAPFVITLLQLSLNYFPFRTTEQNSVRVRLITTQNPRWPWKAPRASLMRAVTCSSALQLVDYSRVFLVSNIFQLLSPLDSSNYTLITRRTQLMMGWLMMGGLMA